MSDNVSNSADKAVAEKPEKWTGKIAGAGAGFVLGGAIGYVLLGYGGVFLPASCAPCLAARLARPSTEFATLDQVRTRCVARVNFLGRKRSKGAHGPLLRRLTNCRLCGHSARLARSFFCQFSGRRVIFSEDSRARTKARNF